MIKSRRVRVGGAPVTVALLMLGAAGASARSTAAADTVVPVNQVAAQDRRPPQLVLRNARFDSVRVELRAGPAAECDQNPILAVRSLPRGRAWGFTTDQPICWRRVADPTRATSEWGGWTRRVLPAGAKVDEAL